MVKLVLSSRLSATPNEHLNRVLHPFEMRVSTKTRYLYTIKFPSEGSPKNETYFRFIRYCVVPSRFQRKKSCDTIMLRKRPVDCYWNRLDFFNLNLTEHSGAYALPRYSRVPGVGIVCR